MSSGLAEVEGAYGSASSETPTRLLVTVKQANAPTEKGRLYRHVGYLDCIATEYQFTYVPDAEDLGHRPLLGFPDLHRVYRSADLFPLFAERIMSAKRPDRARYLDALALAADSEPWEILVRSGGHRAGDTIEVIPEPEIDRDGRTSCLFLAHGVQYRGPEAGAAITRLTPGDTLRLRPDRSNPVNPRAIWVTDVHALELGYVPDPLVEFVAATMEHGEPRVTVVRANGPEVGSHLRLLVRLEGKVSPDLGQRMWPGLRP